MTRSVVPFRAWHHGWLEGAMPLAYEHLQRLERENSWTGVVDGDIVVCAGTYRQWGRRYTAWAHLHPERSGRHMRWITREVMKNLEGVKGRIELTVRADFALGHKWARLLGFEVETPCLKAFGPFEEDHVGYARHN